MNELIIHFYNKGKMSLYPTYSPLDFHYATCNLKCCKGELVRDSRLVACVLTHCMLGYNMAAFKFCPHHFEQCQFWPICTVLSIIKMTSFLVIFRFWLFDFFLLFHHVLRYLRTLYIVWSLVRQQVTQHLTKRQNICNIPKNHNTF